MTLIEIKEAAKAKAEDFNDEFGIAPMIEPELIKLAQEIAEMAFVRGRESTGCWALPAPTITNESAAVMLIRSTSRPRRARRKLNVRILITAKPSMSKSPMSNDFRDSGELCARAKSIEESDFSAS